MRLLFSLHLFVPVRLSGSELYIYRLIKHLQSIGHECRVLLHPHADKTHPNGDYPMDRLMSYDGIQIFPFGLSGVVENSILWCDKMITQLTPTAWTISIGSVYRKPVYHIVHSSDRFESLERNPQAKIIYNSYAMKEEKKYNNDSFVLHPIIPKMEQSDGECILMVNLNENKGVHIFYDIVAQLKDERFLGLKGTYSEQVESDLPNVQIIEPTENITDVFKEAKILLVPSLKESWSMTAAEAMSAGIPVISTGTLGLRENCQDAGIYCDRNAQSFIDEILKLKKNYLSKQQAVLARAQEHRQESAAELVKFNEWLHSQ